MTRETFVFIVTLITVNAVYAQKGRDSAVVRLSFEVANKQDRYTKTNTNKQGKVPERDKNYRFSIGARIAPNFVLETGYFRETYWIRIKEKSEYDAWQNFTSAHIIPLRLCHQVRLLNVTPKCPVRFNSSFGYLFAKETAGAGLLNSTSTFDWNFLGTTMKGKAFSKNVAERFGLWEIRLQLEASISKWISFYAGWGHCYGTRIIGKANATYSLNGAPEKSINTISKGTNRYLNAGIRVRVPNFWSKFQEK